MAETEITLCSYYKGGIKSECLHNNVVHVSGFCGEDGGIVELNAVSLVDTLFSYGQLVMI
jgi:hypothetical protein